jgi:Domain of Unknown Function (DUF1080)
MSVLKIALLAALLLGLTALISCNDNDEDEKRPNGTNEAAQSASQTPRETPDADEGEEGPATPAAVSGEKAAPQQASGKQFDYNFDSDPVGQLPAKFHSAKTGAGASEKWVVTTDPTAPSKPNIVAQVSTDQTDYRFPLLIADEGSFQDLDISVKVKVVSGSIDRAGGLVFRLKDANNYYIVRANALENNYRLYHVVNGRRSQFAGANLKVTSGEWHELRVELVGNKFACYYDGNKKIEATDDTFKDPGKIGLWTKADSVTYFDDLKVRAR